MRKILAWILSTIIGASLQFGIFIFAYQKLTFPFIHEEQRVENAPYIFGYVAPAILLATVISLLIYYFISKQNNKA